MKRTKKEKKSLEKTTLKSLLTQASEKMGISIKEINKLLLTQTYSEILNGYTFKEAQEQKQKQDF